LRSIYDEWELGTDDTCYPLKWDLVVLEGLPLLKVLDCRGMITGDLNSLRVPMALPGVYDSN
jgi:hypothetical protein